MRLRQIKIIALFLLCLIPVASISAQPSTPPPPVPPPPPGLPIDNYIPVMIIVAMFIGVYFLRKSKTEKMS